VSDNIWIRRGEIDKTRREKMREVMDEYDDTVYYPALKQLREDCEKDGGHKGGTFHNNGLGWSWYYCGRCGGRYDIIGPNGEKDDSAKEN